MFKIGHSKELPAIPEHLSDDGKDFVRQCLQRNPSSRPSAAQLLDHPFVRNAAPLERPIPSPEPSDAIPSVTNGVRTLVCVFSRLFWCYCFCATTGHIMNPNTNMVLCSFELRGFLSRRTTALLCMVFGCNSLGN